MMNVAVSYFFVLFLGYFVGFFNLKNLSYVAERDYRRLVIFFLLSSVMEQAERSEENDEISRIALRHQQSIQQKNCISENHTRLWVQENFSIYSLRG